MQFPLSIGAREGCLYGLVGELLLTFLGLIIYLPHLSLEIQLYDPGRSIWLHAGHTMRAARLIRKLIRSQNHAPFSSLVDLV